MYNVQRRATRLVDGLKYLSYNERLQRIGLSTLVYRRASGDMIEVFKHFTTYKDDIIPSSFQPRQRISRKHNHQLARLRSNDDVRGVQSNSFYYRCAKVWNNLPQNVVNASNINNFKNLLDEHWSQATFKYGFMNIN